VRAQFAKPGAAAAVLGFGIPGLIGLADGGYFPTAWGWSALALLWLAATALLVQPEIALARLELGFVATLCALTAWTLASVAWAAAPQEPVLEAERTVVYVAGCLAALLVVRRQTVSHFLGGTLAGIAVVSTYGLATRLFPDRLGRFDPIAGYRLSSPLGYWNALGILAVLGLLLALALAAHAGSLPMRMLAAASVPPLACTLYFTYSRGSWIALFLGLLAALVYDRRRLQLLAIGTVLSLPAAVTVFLAERSSALTHVGVSVADATQEGHRLAGWIAELAVLSAVAALAAAAVERRVPVPPFFRRLAAIAVVLIVLAGLAATVVEFGSPVSITRRAYYAFTAPTQATGPDLNRRLFTFSSSGRIALWHVAWRAYEEHPLLGLGAGGYTQAWHARRPIQGMARDAHNLYLELLAELGPLGLGLLALAFAVPLAATRRARGHPFAPAAFATFVAYLAHAVADWDWEMPAVSLTALTCAAMLLILARPEQRASMSPRARALGLGALTAAGGLVLVTLVGNLALSSSVQAAREDRWARSAAEAQRAASWIPWAAEPWQRLGEAQLALGRTAQARMSFEQALRKDRRDWTIWLDLAAANTGAGERRALAEASRLNPLSPEIAAFRAGAAGTTFRAGG
jgi:hypothetical protein